MKVQKKRGTFARSADRLLVDHFKRGSATVVKR